MKKNYKVTNISGYLIVLGLYPGKSKIISCINEKINKLAQKGLITISEIEERIKPIKEAIDKEKIDDNTPKEEVSE